MFKSPRYLKPPQGYTFILLLGCVVSCLGVTLRDSKGGLGLGSGGSRGGISRGVGGSRIGIPWLFRTLVDPQIPSRLNPPGSISLWFYAVHRAYS